MGQNPERDLAELVSRLDNPAALATKPAISISPYVRQKHALVIGIGKFQNAGITPLPYTANDAEAFAKVLRTQCRFDFVKTLSDESATTKNIKTEMGRLAEQTTAEDLVVVFIAGHGSPEDADSGGVNYILTYDTEPDNLYATAYEMNDLLNDIERRIPAERVVAFIDTCYSGATFKEKPKVWVSGSRDFGLPVGLRTEVIKERLLRADKGVKVNPPAASGQQGRKQGVGRAIIASSRQNQRSWESKRLQHGYFTYFLLEALTKRDPASLSELFQYLSEAVSNAVQLNVPAQQNPTMVASATTPLEIFLKDVQ